MQEQPPTQPPTQPRRPAPAMILFLLFPLLGLAAAAVMILNESPAGGSIARTPEPVTLAPPQVVANAPMIDFTLTTLDGETVSLSDYAGRVVFLNFWATWCEPCKKELPAFQQFQTEQPPDGAIILAVNVMENAEQVAVFLDEYGIDALTVPLDPDRDAADRYGVFNLPATFVIDQRGVVRYPKYGEVTLAELEMYVAALTEA